LFLLGILRRMEGLGKAQGRCIVSRIGAERQSIAPENLETLPQLYETEEMECARYEIPGGTDNEGLTGTIWKDNDCRGRMGLNGDAW
jgi:hypothetical protein